MQELHFEAFHERMEQLRREVEEIRIPRAQDVASGYSQPDGVDARDSDQGLGDNDIHDLRDPSTASVAQGSDTTATNSSKVPSEQLQLAAEVKQLEDEAYESYSHAIYLDW